MLTREGLERLTRNVRFTGSLRRELRRLVEFRAGRGCGKISSDIYHWMPNGGWTGGGDQSGGRETWVSRAEMRPAWASSGCGRRKWRCIHNDAEVGQRGLGDGLEVTSPLGD